MVKGHFVKGASKNGQLKETQLKFVEPEEEIGSQGHVINDM